MTDDDLQKRSMIEEIYLGKGFTLQQLTPTKVIQGEEQCQESSKAQLSVRSAAKILADASRERVKTYTRRRSTDSSKDSTTRGLFSTAEEVQGKEQISTDEKVSQKLNDEEMARVSDTIKRYQTPKKKPVSVAQARKNMMIYLKNMAGYKMGHFKGMSYDEIRPVFEEEYNKIVLVEEIKAKALQVKYPIIDWEIHTKGSRKYWKIIKVRNITEAYKVFADMLKGFDNEDLVTFWSLVKERFRSAEPTEDNERALWLELKRLFEPDKDDVLWNTYKDIM
ncbi:hypothetical protein Tco_1174492 [Tanacetum coccineum]